MNIKVTLSLLLISLLSAGGLVLANPVGVAATVEGKEISERKLHKSIDSYLRQQGTDITSVSSKYKQNKRNPLRISKQKDGNRIHRKPPSTRPFISATSSSPT